MPDVQRRTQEGASKLSSSAPFEQDWLSRRYVYLLDPPPRQAGEAQPIEGSIGVYAVREYRAQTIPGPQSAPVQNQGNSWILISVALPASIFPVEQSSIVTLRRSQTKRQCIRISARCARPMALSPEEPKANSSDLRTFEEAYQKLGSWKGAEATEEVQEEAAAVFVRAGARAAGWLVSRMVNEWNNDVLYELPFVLADIGSEAVLPILHALEDRPTKNQREVLLWALARMEPSSLPSNGHLLAVLIDNAGLSGNLRAREAAYKTLAKLDSERARSVLQDAQRAELDRRLNALLSKLINARHN